MFTGPRISKSGPWRESLLGTVFVALSVQGALAQSDAGSTAYTYGLYGTPGLIDVPTAQSAADAELAATVGYFGGSTRTTLTFQVTPRLSGSFRYSRIEDWAIATGDTTYDRSFDLRYRLVDEGRISPAIAIGLQDIIGTGIYSGEYIVATKQVTPTLGLTGGIGWGRLGSYEGFRNPLRFLGDDFEERDTGTTGFGGQFESARWFRGDAAFFGGVAWNPNDQLTLKAEYSSDAYDLELASGRDLFERKSSLNFGLSYALSDSVAMQGYYLYGSELGASVNFTINPKEPTVYGGTGQRPTPVVPRAPGAALDLGWTQQADANAILSDNVKRLLAAEGMTLEAMTIRPQKVTVLIRNNTYMAGAEAIGRTARILTRTMPASVETFTIIPMEGGIRTAAVTIMRSDLEQLEFEPDNAWISYVRADISDAASVDAQPTYQADLYPHLQWRLGPYVTTSYFDPDSPVRANVGIALSADYDAAPGLTFSAELRKPLAGNQGDGQLSASALPRVRTDGQLYAAEGDPAITRLTTAFQTNLATDFYGRVTAGYLESMYGGLSTELLWKPVDSPLGIGVELNYVRKRDFDQLFGLQDYNVVTGHVSGYYDLGNSFHAQLDVGRYLAGDYGATIALDREFDNGWRIGAFATFTDVSFDDFGEGSFDKGLRVSFPLGHFVGTPTRRVYSTTLRPLVRDGGARLSVENRLYETVRHNHDSALRGNWGRFWR
ncbi:YjbH domain-containing protein [Yoonia sp. SDW83-1]|uniref:YjbH domain-containing protein n=1 Tax=Yoonia sp. SDW83-1 TaxID=3366945 RepID=UPI00398C37B6